MTYYFKRISNHYSHLKNFYLIKGLFFIGFDQKTNKNREYLINLFLPKKKEFSLSDYFKMPSKLLHY